MKMENDLGRDPIWPLVWRIAMPSMLAQFVSVLYSIVDRIYISNIPGAGAAALAGVGVCGPVVTMVGAVSSLIAIGGAPMMSIRMGAGDCKRAREILANCFLMLCAASVLLMAIILPLRRPMLLLFGASPSTYHYADAYFTAYLLGTPFALIAGGMNQFIICQGYARIGMKSVILGATLNILLDPVFIFLLDMGVRGAAVATVLSQLASTLYVLRVLLSPFIPVRITFSGYQPALMLRVLTLGLTPFLIIAADNVMIIAMNGVLQHYGGAEQGDMLITCATIVQSFMLVVTMPLGGISGGTQTILGYNYGARQPNRVRLAQRYILLLCMGYTAFMTLLANLAGPLFVRLFTRDAVLASQAFWAIRVCTLAIIPLGAQYAVVDGFTALGQVRFSLPLSFWRKLVYFSCVFLLPALFGAQAAFFAEPVSDIAGPLVSALVCRSAMDRILNRQDRAQVPPC